MKGQALLRLLQAVAIIGIDPEKVEPLEKENGDVKVLFHLFDNATIIVTVTDKYWRYPNMACYFVNYSHENGDLSARAGTPHIECAIFDLGQCIETANATNLRRAK